jgi:transposase
MTADLLALADWLQAAGCTPVAMESTGGYWKPIYTLREDAVTLLLVNAQHLKTVRGGTTEVKGAQWIAELLRHGLLRASCLPDHAQRELRERTRYRTALIRERSAEVHRLQKVLEGATSTLASVASTVVGISGRAMLAALSAGQTASAQMADVARGRLRKKLPALERALEGHMGSHQRFLLAQQVAHLDSLQTMIERVSAQSAERLRPYEALLVRLQTIPGVGRRTAEVLLAELGVDLSRFPRAAHLASWAGVCPGNQVSAGKRSSGKARKGNPWLRAVLVEAAQSAGRGKDSYLAAQYRRLTVRRGRKRAALAVAHTLLVIVSHLLTREQDDRDLGSSYCEERDRQAVQRRLIQRLEAMGLQVTVEPAPPAA